MPTQLNWLYNKLQKNPWELPLNLHWDTGWTCLLRTTLHPWNTWQWREGCLNKPRHSFNPCTLISNPHILPVSCFHLHELKPYDIFQSTQKEQSVSLNSIWLKQKTPQNMPSPGLFLVSTEIILALSTYCETAVIAELEFFLDTASAHVEYFRPVASSCTPITCTNLPCFSAYN